MPDGIKYSTTVQTSSLQKGNVAIGIGNVGPTSATDFYSVPVPVSGKYIVSKVSASGFPLFFSPADEAEMIKLAKQEGATGANTASLASCLNYFATQTNYSVANLDYEDIVTSGSLLTLDAGFTTSYPTTGSTWYDLSGNSYNGTLTNGPTFNSGSNGSIVFDGTDDYVITSNTTYNFSTNANFTYCAWIYPSFSSSSNTGRAVINSTSPSNPNVRAYLRWEGPGLGFYFDMATSAWYTTSTTFSANTWHYLCFTHSSSNAGSYYFDGTAVTTVSNPGGLATITNNPITIGYGSINSYYWSGRISNVQIYNRALTASEVLQNYNAQKGRYADLLLDTYTGAAAAYSVRKLRTAYTGSAIRVRRSSDNTEQDIGFSGNDLDTSALTTFVGANNGFVTTWYDQSGNARNAIQSTAVNQPQIVSSGTILTENSKPSLRFNGSYMIISSVLLNNTNLSCYFVTLPKTTYTFGGILTNKTSGADDANAINFLNSGKIDMVYNGTFSFVTQLNVQTSLFQGTALWDSTNITLRTNGVQDGTATKSGTQTFSTQTWMGSYRQQTTNLGNFSMPEVILYQSNQSANNTNIENNLKTYYGT
jgi:hypothetical protein